MSGLRIFTEEDLKAHSNGRSCWVLRGGKIYDVTQFLADHPGGDDLIIKFAGKDVGEIMKDAAEHDHSDSAYQMLEEYCIGRLGSNVVTVSDGEVIVRQLGSILMREKIGSQRTISIPKIPILQLTSKNANFLTLESLWFCKSCLATSGKRRIHRASHL